MLSRLSSTTELESGLLGWKDMTVVLVIHLGVLPEKLDYCFEIGNNPINWISIQFAFT